MISAGRSCASHSVPGVFWLVAMKMGMKKYQYNCYYVVRLGGKLYIPVLGIKGSNQFGPICLSWKTLRTSSHLFVLPSPDPQQHARRKKPWVHRAPIFLSNPVLVLLSKKKHTHTHREREKWSPALEVQVSPNPKCQVSGEATFQASGIRADHVERSELPLQTQVERKLLRRELPVWRRHVVPSWLDRQQRRYRNVTCLYFNRLHPPRKKQPESATKWKPQTSNAFVFVFRVCMKGGKIIVFYNATDQLPSSPST